MMKSVILKKCGDDMVMEEVPVPSPKANEVLVKVRAIGVNPVDYKVRSGDEVVKMIMGKLPPVTIGWDIAGVVDKVGDAVTRFKVGDAVFGMVRFPGEGCGYAEYVASPEEHLALKPTGVSFEAAAATTLAALTALQCLTPRVQSGSRVLIHAGSGGVGHYAIQIAKAMGAHVTTTSSGKNREFCMHMGADEHIDYRTTQFEEVCRDLDFVLDPMGGETARKCVRVVRKGGRIVTLPGPVADDIQADARRAGLEIEFVMVASSGADMETLAAMLAEGKIKPHVSKTFGFGELNESHAYLQAGRTVGKAVIVM